MNTRLAHLTGFTTITLWKTARSSAPKPKPRRRRSRNPWRDMVTESYRMARIEWEQRLEDVTMLYPEEMRDFREEHPPPRFRDFLTGLRYETNPDEESDPRFALGETA